MKPKELVKLLKSNGYIFIRQTESHAIYKNNESKTVVVPIHNRDIPKGTLHGIIKDAGLEELKVGGRQLKITSYELQIR